MDLPFEIMFNYLSGKNENKSKSNGKEIAVYLPDVFAHFTKTSENVAMVPTFALNDSQVVNLLGSDKYLSIINADYS